jgi:hypothetical protein
MGRDRPLAIARAFQRIVMKNDWNAIGGKTGVELNPIGTIDRGALERGKSIFRRHGHGAAVPNQTGWFRKGNATRSGSGT